MSRLKELKQELKEKRRELLSLVLREFDKKLIIETQNEIVDLCKKIEEREL